MVRWWTLWDGECAELLEELLAEEILHMLDFREPKELGLLGGVWKFQAPLSHVPFRSAITCKEFQRIYQTVQNPSRNSIISPNVNACSQSATFLVIMSLPLHQHYHHRHHVPSTTSTLSSSSSLYPIIFSTILTQDVSLLTKNPSRKENPSPCVSGLYLKKTEFTA